MKGVTAVLFGMALLAAMRFAGAPAAPTPGSGLGEMFRLKFGVTESSDDATKLL